MVRMERNISAQRKAVYTTLNDRLLISELNVDITTSVSNENE